MRDFESLRLDASLARTCEFEPGALSAEEKRTDRFKIDANSDATARSCSINSAINYIDIRGKALIFDSMKAR